MPRWGLAAACSRVFAGSRAGRAFAQLGRRAPGSSPRDLDDATPRAHVVRRIPAGASSGCPYVMDRGRKELALFLQSRRQRLKPADAGLPSGRRRRTPGLRREEVAELAGIGASWYTFLEQGRDVRPSEGALRRIAKALQLDPAEQRYLLRLGLEPGERTREQRGVPGELVAILESLHEPAAVMSRAWDVVYSNEAANALYDFPCIPHGNLLRLIFHPEFRALYANWEQRARQLIGTFRLQNAASLRDVRVMEVLEELERSPEFGDYWRAQTVREENSGHVTMDHPFVGRLQLNYTMLGVLDCPGLLVELCFSDGEESRRRLAELVRQVRDGEHSPDHNLLTALASKVQWKARYGRVG